MTSTLSNDTFVFTTSANSTMSSDSWYYTNTPATKKKGLACWPGCGCDSDEPSAPYPGWGKPIVQGWQQPKPTPPPTVTIGGVEVTADLLVVAITCLREAKGSAVKKPLAAIEHPLLNCDYRAVAAIESALDPNLRQGKDKTKLAFLLHLEKQLALLDPKKSELVGPGELRFVYAAVQPQFGGQHRKFLLVDHLGGQWVFKPAPQENHRFRPEVEHAAHDLARQWGFKTAESQLIEYDGRYGQIQRLLPVDHDLRGVDLTTLTTPQLCAIAREHLLDWAIDNDDSHAENIVILTDGSVVGIDKGRAWRYFGGWSGLSADASANSNAQLVYTTLYDLIQSGSLDRRVVDAMYRAVITTARRMQRLPDAKLRDTMTQGLSSRPHFKAPSYCPRPVPDAPTNAQELINAAVTRKNKLVVDMRELWSRVYDGAGWTLPDSTTSPLGVNTQGHPLHSGLHSPELHETLTQTKSYGTATFVAGDQIEDAHILLWRERRLDGEYNIRGQFKARGAALDKLEDWLCGRAVPVDVVYAEQRAPSCEDYYYGIITQVAQHISDHHKDGQYSEYTLGKLTNLKTQMTAEKDNYSKYTGTIDDTNGIYYGYVKVAELYLGYIDVIEQHLADKTEIDPAHLPRYQPTPKQAPQPLVKSPPSVKVQLRNATRAAANMNGMVSLTDDGELQLTAKVLDDKPDEYRQGQPGRMYLVILETGEEIEFRGAKTTDTPLSSQGLVQLTIPDADNLAESLKRICAHLAVMGLQIDDADRQDLELYYWRHLSGIMADRVDAKKDGKAKDGELVPAYVEFWKRVDTTKNTTKADEIEMWRNAFAAITDREQIDAFVASDGHLPLFMHMDLRNPDQPTGKPYWERFDVTDADCVKRQMPTLTYRSGPTYVMKTGVAMATEARIRTFATWKSGQSSTEDMFHGSAAFVFTRLNSEETSYVSPNVYFNPRILRRTTNYNFANDHFGRITDRQMAAYFNFDQLTSFTGGSNECLIKDALSLLDDVELMFFPSADCAAAIKKLAELGITEIRGVPVTSRLVARSSSSTRSKAISFVKATIV